MSTLTKRFRETKENDDFLEKFALAVIRVLAREALIYNMDDALESLKNLWRDGVLQEYVDQVPELQELIELGKLP